MKQTKDMVAPLRRANDHHGAQPWRDGPHLAAVLAIADDLDRPVGEVSVLYHDLLLSLTASATVFHFLPVLIARKIRERYRSQAEQ